MRKTILMSLVFLSACSSVAGMNSDIAEKIEISSKPTENHTQLYCLQAEADKLVGQSDFDIDEVKLLTQASIVEVIQQGEFSNSDNRKTRLRIYTEPLTKVVLQANCH